MKKNFSAFKNISTKSDERVGLGKTHDVQIATRRNIGNPNAPWRNKEAPGSWFQLDPALGIMTIWEINQQVQEFSISVCL